MGGGEDAFHDPLFDDIGENGREGPDHLDDGEDVELRVAAGVELLGEFPLGLIDSAGGHHRRELADRAARPFGDGPGDRGGPLGRPADDGPQDLVLGGEMVVKGAFRDPDLGDDVFDGCVLESLSDE